MRRIFGPGPGCSATRCPARLNGAPSTHWVLNPSLSNSARKTLPTSRTPAWFWVPLLMLTERSSSASASSLCASMKVTSAFSSVVKPVCAIPTVVVAATTRTANRNPATPLTFGVPPSREALRRTRRSLGGGGWSLTFGVDTMQSSYPAQLPAQDRHRSERRLAELSCIDADRPFQVVRQRLAGDR